MPHLDPQDQRPPDEDAQIRVVDPADVEFGFLIDPTTDQLDYVVMKDARGELLAMFSIEETLDDVILMPERVARAA